MQKSLVKTTIDGRTTLHLAADYGQLEVLEYLAAQGADINAKDKHGISVILAAIWEGHSKCVKFLLDKVSIDTSQLPGRLFSPSDNCKKLSHNFLLHFSIGMGSYDHHAKYQGVFP